MTKTISMNEDKAVLIRKRFPTGIEEIGRRIGIFSLASCCQDELWYTESSADEGRCVEIRDGTPVGELESMWCAEATRYRCTHFEGMMEDHFCLGLWLFVAMRFGHTIWYIVRRWPLQGYEGWDTLYDGFIPLEFVRPRIHDVWYCGYSSLRRQEA